jgi:hypothetical protein
MPTETPLDTDELRRMARAPQHYSNYTLAGALHQALDRLEAAEREREVVCYETGHAIKAALDVAHDDCVRAEQAEQRAQAAERERDAILADRDRWRDVAETEHLYTKTAETQAEQASARAERQQDCARDRLAEISGDVLTYEDAFRKLEIACAALRYIAADDPVLAADQEDQTP